MTLGTDEVEENENETEKGKGAEAGTDETTEKNVEAVMWV